MIFWKHIKGLSGNGIYSFIRFEAENTSANMINLPQVFLNTNTAFSSTYNCGHLLTSKMLGGFIEEDFTFKSDVDINGKISLVHNPTEQASNHLIFSFDDDVWSIETQDDLNMECVNYIMNCTNYTINSINDIAINNGITTHRIKVTGISGTEYNGSCEADYFNATSDYRAKKDFKPLNINALELVNKIQLYSFKYKESNQPSIGIIAQDVQDVNIEGFDLVDNKNATGANFDYMSIHESKLVYILWKAVQEQQKEIEELKQQLKK